MKSLLIVVLVLAIAAVLVNDGSQYFSAYNGLSNSSQALAHWASGNISSQTQQQFGAQLEKQAAAQRIRVTQFAIDPASIRIWTETHVTGTWLLGPAIAVWGGTPLQKARGSDFVIKRVTTANYG